MTKKLFKIAKELNVATSTIVDFLNHSGFEIENKPIAKISDEMYALLLDEFSSAIAEKERADQLLQQRLERKKSDGAEVKPKEEDLPEEKIEKEPIEEPVEEPVKETEKPEEQEAEKEEAIEEKEKLKLKIVGKIDLDAQKKKPAKKKKSEKAEKPEEQ